MRYRADLDPSMPCETYGHVYGPIQGNVRLCQRHGCTMRSGLDPEPEDFLTFDGLPYDFTDPDRDSWAHDGTDAYRVRI